MGFKVTTGSCSRFLVLPDQRSGWRILAASYSLLSSTKSVKVPPLSIPIKVTADFGPGRGLCEQSGRKGIARRRCHCACTAIIRTVTKATARETDTATEIATASAKFSSSSNTGGLDDLGSSDFRLRYEDNSVKRWVMFRISVRLQCFPDLPGNIGDGKVGSEVTV